MDGSQRALESLGRRVIWPASCQACAEGLCEGNVVLSNDELLAACQMIPSPDADILLSLLEQFLDLCRVRPRSVELSVPGEGFRLGHSCR